MHFPIKPIAGVLFLLLLCGCGNIKNDQAKRSQLLRQTWCKRYTGTIAGQQVVVNLYNFPTFDNPEKRILGGSYYYRGKSEILDLQRTVTDSGSSPVVRTSEYLCTARNDEGDGNTPQSNNDPQWEISFDGNKIAGQWHSADGKKTEEIVLAEDYGTATKLDILYHTDSISMEGLKYDASATTNFLCASPANADDARFFFKEMLAFRSDDSIEAPDIKQYMQRSCSKYLADYKKDMALMAADSIYDEPRQGYFRNISILPEYNDNGILVLELNWESYDGGAHGNYANDHLCLDMQAHKRIKLGDVLQIDSIKISALLGEAAHKAFKVPANESLDKALLQDAVPATENFVISDKGLTFCYSPYEIASFADGDIFLFVPYSKLKDLLRADFKNRMKLPD